MKDYVYLSDMRNEHAQEIQLFTQTYNDKDAYSAVQERLGFVVDDNVISYFVNDNQDDVVIMEKKVVDTFLKICSYMKAKEFNAEEKQEIAATRRRRYFGNI
jgi:hypothetical protein